MERIVVFDEQNGARIDALLNPESLSWRRRAGVRSRLVGERPVMRPEAREDTLVFVGGGVTDIDLNLLFDTRLLPGRLAPAARSGADGGSGAGPKTYRDVRDLTCPLWALTEPQPLGGRNSPIGLRPQLLIWGEWSVRVVVVAIAERFEEFDIDGMPRRAWVSMALRRVETDAADAAPDADPAATGRVPEIGAATVLDQFAHSVPDVDVNTMNGDLSAAVAMTGLGGLGRPDLLAQEVFGDARLWPHLMDRLGLEDPLTTMAPPPESPDPAGPVMAEDAR